MNLPANVSEINAYLALAVGISAILFGSLLWRLGKIFASKEMVQDHEARIRELERKAARMDTTK